MIPALSQREVASPISPLSTVKKASLCTGAIRWNNSRRIPVLSKLPIFCCMATCRRPMSWPDSIRRFDDTQCSTKACSVSSRAFAMTLIRWRCCLRSLVQCRRITTTSWTPRIPGIVTNSRTGFLPSCRQSQPPRTSLMSGNPSSIRATISIIAKTSCTCCLRYRRNPTRLILLPRRRSISCLFCMPIMNKIAQRRLSVWPAVLAQILIRQSRQAYPLFGDRHTEVRMSLC